MSDSLSRQGNAIREEGFFVGKGGARLYFQKWIPKGDVKSNILLVHGLFEHSGRYTNLIEFLVPKGYAVVSLDHRGHGKSEGMRGYVNRFADYLDDLNLLWESQLAKSKTPVFVFGHSVGGLIATLFVSDRPGSFSGLLLSAPAIRPGSSVNTVSIIAARILSVVLPKLGVSRLEAGGVCSDPSVVERYVSDPLVYTGKIRARLGAELFAAMRRVPSQARNIELPVLLMHGTEDRLSNSQGSAYLFEVVKSEDKKLNYYQGFCHEILNEPGRERVLNDILEWLVAHRGVNPVATAAGAALARGY